MANAFLDRRLSGTERRTGWLMAEQGGLKRPYRVRSLSARGCWCTDEFGNVVRHGALVVNKAGSVRVLMVALAKTAPDPRRRG